MRCVERQVAEVPIVSAGLRDLPRAGRRRFKQLCSTQTVVPAICLVGGPSHAVTDGTSVSPHDRRSKGRIG